MDKIIALFIGVTFGCISTFCALEYKHQDFIKKLNATNQKIQENQVLRERELNSTISTLLEESHGRQLEIERLSGERAVLIKRLRDPGSSCGGIEAGNKSSGSDSSTATGTELSVEATQFLLSLTRDADLLREQLRLCQNWAKSIAR